MKTQAFRALVFDMDGTILDTLEDLKNAVNAALSAHGFPERTLDEVRSFVGNGISVLVRRALPSGTDDATWEAVLSDFRVYYRAHCTDVTRPYDGIVETVKKLREAGYPTAVVSNKADFAVQDLVTRFFDGLFDVAMGERESEGVRKKPAPDSVLCVLDRLGVAPADALYIGDSEVDVETAANAGTQFLGVAWGFRGRAFLENLGAELLADTPQEMYRLICEGNGNK